jgi:hypothetical protein
LAGHGTSRLPLKRLRFDASNNYSAVIIRFGFHPFPRDIQHVIRLQIGTLLTPGKRERLLPIVEHVA